MLPRKPSNKLTPPSAILKHPYGLPSWIKAAQYLKSQVWFLPAYAAAIGPEVRSMKPLRTVLDTGAGHTLIRANLLMLEVLASYDTERAIVNLASASNHRLQTLGIVKLTVKIAYYAVRQPFVVVRQLGADALLGCTYIDKHVEQVRPRIKFIQLANGVRVPIRRREQEIPLHRPTEEAHGVTLPPALTQSCKGPLCKAHACASRHGGCHPCFGRSVGNACLVLFPELV